MTTFGERLSFLRKAAGLTQKQLGEVVSVCGQSIHQYETGKRRPCVEIMEAFCDYFNVSMDYLLGKSSFTIRIVRNNEMTMFIHGQICNDQAVETLTIDLCGDKRTE